MNGHAKLPEALQPLHHLQQRLQQEFETEGERKRQIDGTAFPSTAASGRHTATRSNMLQQYTHGCYSSKVSTSHIFFKYRF